MEGSTIVHGSGLIGSLSYCAGCVTYQNYGHLSKYNVQLYASPDYMTDSRL